MSTSLPTTLAEIREAHDRISPYVLKTPFIPFSWEGLDIYLKCETFQRTGSFKIRGAANCILKNLVQARKTGVIAASAGNHAQGVAAMSKTLGIKATIVMPTITPPIKVQNTLKWGAHVELVGQVYDESYEYARQLADEQRCLFIPAFKDPLVIAGQGTIGLELSEQPAFADIEAVVISVGGGGLITGVATALRSLHPKIKIYGVGAANAASNFKSFHAKKVVEAPTSFTLAEGVATGKRADATMLGYLIQQLDDFFALSEESIAHAISVFSETGKMIVEGAGALPLAAVLENKIPHKNIALLISGGNADISTLYHVLQRELVSQGRMARIVVTITDRPGGLHAVTKILADTGANILQVFHQRASLKAGVGEAEIEIDMETRNAVHTLTIIDTLTQRGYQVNRAT
jgi:threonine dehydratase